MNFVFLMNPLETVIYEKDTSFIFMVGAARRGHDIYYLAPGGLTLADGQLAFRVERVTPQLDPAQPFRRHGGERLSGSDVDAVFIRTDPPFDRDYLMQTWLLDHLPARALVMNNPAGVRTVNEKVWAMRFPDLLPPSLLTRHQDDYAAFLAQHREVIVKPTDGFGGSGVFRVSAGEANANVIFETLSERGRQDVIIQRYIPEAAAGDKRILLLDGELLGAILRVHGPADHRNNFFAGGRPEPVEVTARDREIIARLGPELRRLGLCFVGIDVLGDFLIEVNVTSPTCLQEVNRAMATQLEDQVIDFVERRLAELRQPV